MQECFCPCHAVCGGPSHRAEKCPKCGIEHMVYRSGSHDWEPRQCTACFTEEFLSTAPPQRPVDEKEET